MDSGPPSPHAPSAPRRRRTALSGWLDAQAQQMPQQSRNYPCICHGTAVSPQVRNVLKRSVRSIT